MSINAVECVLSILILLELQEKQKSALSNLRLSESPAKAGLLCLRCKLEFELKQWITYLISVDKLYRFYKSKRWLSLKHEVLVEQHYECQLCKEEHRLTILREGSPVHHVKEVKKYPELALSKFYTDANGKQQRQLIAVCEDCHNRLHNRFQKKKSGFINEERW